MVIAKFSGAGAILKPFRGAFHHRFGPSAGWFAPGGQRVPSRRGKVTGHCPPRVFTSYRLLEFG